jgi:class 3 adenylate cyclase
VPAGVPEAFIAILFADLVGAASMFGRRGDEHADAVRREHFAALRSALAAHGGREVRSTGEGLMGAFPSAVAAVRCAVDMQRAADRVGHGLALSVGLDAGEPLPDAEELYGTPVIVAAGLCDAAGAGEILASDVVCRIAGPRISAAISPMGAVRVRGADGRVAAGQVHWRDEEASPRPAADPAPEITVVIADDQRLLRAGFRVILDAEPDGAGRTSRSWTSACPSSTGCRPRSASWPTPSSARRC